MKIVVAGDVCIDWLSIPVESLVPGANQPEPMNWELRGGHHMYAVRGGTWLTADFVAQAVGSSAAVLKPSYDELPLENVPPEKIIHSMLTLGPSDREREKEKVPYWVVTRFDGYAGPAHPAKPEVKSVTADDPDARIVLLDDAGNGFRDSKEAWPLALNQRRAPLVLYKVRRPLAKGSLWEHLKAFHLDRTIALLSADNLRAEGASISRGLSWEKTATDLILALAHEPRFAALRGCPFLIIPLALEAAVLLRNVRDRVSSAHLWYLPNCTEGESLRSGRGEMSGFGSAFAAALAKALAQCESLDNEQIDKALSAGIDEGLGAMHNLLEEAFGPCKVNPRDKHSPTRPPEYPVKKIFQLAHDKTPTVFDVALPKPPANRGAKDISAFRSWRILDSKREKAFVELAVEDVKLGVEKVFTDVPLGQFGRFVTLDPREIESYRAIRNLIKEFLGNPKAGRPLCLGVFGPPGGGKSFGVAEVARSLDQEGQIAKLDFNVSQWTSVEHLVGALHRVRDYGLLGKVPLVFFDEFDARFGAQPLGWLKYFLAPMQDGVFADGPFTHEIGKAIFVFAGGTVDRFEEFRAKTKSAEEKVDRPATETETKGIGDEETEREAVRKAENTEAKRDEIRSVKLLDFVSRLRGHVDVFGINGPSDTNLLRRALILRSNIEKKFPTLIDAIGAVRIDDGVLRAFLQVPEYYHGARSLEAILDMSHLVGRTHFDPSLLPPLHQLNLHVNGNEFMNLIQHQQLLGAKLDEIAKEIHELFLRDELAKQGEDGNPCYQIGDRPSLNHWDDLNDLYKNSSREQGANYPVLLAAAGCGFEEGNPDPDFEFSETETENLARMEHERWMQERRIRQPDHPDLIPWEKLSKEEQAKDIRTVKAIPDILGKVGLRVVRLT